MIRTLLSSAAVAALVVLSATPASGQVVPAVDSVVAMSRAINVAKDKSLAFRLNGQVGELVVAQPSIAEIVAKTDQSFYIRGKAFGSTNILVYGPNQQLIEVIDVRVTPDAEALRQDLAASLPGENIRVVNVADGFMLSGSVSNSARLDRAVNVAKRYAGEQVSHNLQVLQPEQVVLEVRILEASRNALRELGVDLTVTGSEVQVGTGSGLLGINPPTGTISGQALLGNTSIDLTIQALEENGVVRLLAEPNLVAMSGAEASFLAGGEFPFPVPSGRDQITIEFKPFGVNLKFTPEVRDGGRIRMKVEPEVSQIDDQTSVRINNIVVPGLSVRRVSTTVELDEGRSFAIAGLFQRDQVTTARQVPGLGDLPILGALFRSKRWQDQETELVIIVTPRLADMNAPIRNPLDNVDSESRPADTARTAQAAPAPIAPVALPAPLAPPVTAPLAAPAPAPVVEASVQAVVVTPAAAAEPVEMAPAITAPAPAPAPTIVLQGPVIETAYSALPPPVVAQPVVFVKDPDPSAPAHSIDDILARWGAQPQPEGA